MLTFSGRRPGSRTGARSPHAHGVAGSTRTVVTHRLLAVTGRRFVNALALQSVSSGNSTTEAAPVETAIKRTRSGRAAGASASDDGAGSGGTVAPSGAVTASSSANQTGDSTVQDACGQPIQAALNALADATNEAAPATQRAWARRWASPRLPSSSTACRTACWEQCQRTWSR
jgi:hypothetical protein